VRAGTAKLLTEQVSADPIVTVEWRDGGETNADEATLRCPPHNIWKTNHRHDPPPDEPDRGQRRVGPEPGPPPHNRTERPAA
jgi:hypothetical protein